MACRHRRRFLLSVYRYLVVDFNALVDLCQAASINVSPGSIPCGINFVKFLKISQKYALSKRAFSRP